jgi:sulfate adenylyltransferase large subunit
MAAAHVDLPAPEWVAATAETELLRFTTAGSVDDGKSTLIGRLLYDSKGVYEDQLASARKATRNQIVGGLDLSLLTDGLRAEREQGITIDVAYRYFSTARRKFIIADTPGHEQYTRNMATGASSADLAIILIDARAGVLPQSRRHAHIAVLLGIRKLVVAVNKMDLVDFREDVFARIRDEFTGFVQQLGVEDARFIPISALDGDNVVEPSRRTPWYVGPCLLEYLETVPLTHASGDEPFRLPVQYVIRPDLNFRGFAGQIAAGTIRRGDPVTVLPSGRTSRVRSIVAWEGDLEEAFAPMSVTICLEDEVDVSRGDMLVPAERTPDSARVIEATLVWMNEKPLVPARPYLLKHTTQTVQARVREICARVDVNTLAEGPAARLELNEIGRVIIEAQRPLFFDPYRQNRATGSFVLIDPITNETAAAGMIRSRAQADEGRGRVSAAERAARNGHGPAVVMLPPGRHELAYAVERLLFIQGWAVCVIEAPDHLRQAVDTAHAAGVVAIVVHSTAGEIVESSLDLTVEEADRPDAAAEIVGRLLPKD